MKYRHAALSVTAFALAIASLTATMQSFSLKAQTSPEAVTVIDDGEPGFSTMPSEGWRRLPYATGYRGDITYTTVLPTAGGWNGQGNSNKRAQWKFTVEPGEFEVQITYPALPSSLQNALLSVYDGETLVREDALDLTKQPTDVQYDGRSWKKLPSVRIAGRALHVVLKAGPKNKGILMIADAVRIVPTPPVPFCGNGTVEGAEECDDGNADNTDACTIACFSARCGDTIVQTTEECDDGNSTNTDACTNACTNPRCGDGFVQNEEECDDGNGVNDDRCSNSCRKAYCGDQIRQGGEECDDGNTDYRDSCAVACQNARCGDAITQRTEECDDGNTNDDDFCKNDCTAPACEQAAQGTGNLYVTQDSIPLRPRQPIGGALGDSMLRLQFRASGEDVDVMDLQFTSKGNTATSIDSLELYTEGQTVPFATATVGRCGSDEVPTVDEGVAVATFCAKMQSQELVITRDTRVAIMVRPRLKTDRDGAIHQRIRLFLSPDPVVNYTTGRGAVRARGVTSTNFLYGNNGDAQATGEIFIGTNENTANAPIIGSINDVVFARINGITNANPDANGSSIPFGVADVGQFRLSAAPHFNSLNGLNRVQLGHLTFSVTARNASLNADHFRFYNKADASVKKECTATLADGTVLHGATHDSFFYLMCGSLADGMVNTSIAQGTDETFVVEAEILNPKISSSQPSRLTIGFDSFTNPDATLGQTASHIEWIDRDAGGDQSFFWVDYPETSVPSTQYES